MLIRGLRNLGIPFGKGFNCCGAKLRLRCADLRFAEPRNSLQRDVFRAFRLYEKNQKYTRGLRTSGLRGTIQIAGRYVFEAKVTGIHQVTGNAENSSFPGIAGNDLNRCDALALQRKELSEHQKNGGIL